MRNNSHSAETDRLHSIHAQCMPHKRLAHITNVLRFLDGINGQEIEYPWGYCTCAKPRNNALTSAPCPAVPLQVFLMRPTPARVGPAAP